MDNKTVRVAVYLRYSTDYQTDDSIEAQLEACKRYIASKGWYFDEERFKYEDKAKSASSVIKRTNFNNMLKDSKDHLFDVLLVHKIDRFSRNVISGGLARYELENAGVKIISVSENVDDTPIGRLTMNMLSMLAEYYVDNLSTEVHKVMDMKARKGMFLGGIAPLGLTVETVEGDERFGKYYAIDEDEAIIVRKIFDLYANKRYGWSKIAEILNADGDKSKYGNPFCQNSVREIIMNEKYVGKYIWNKRVAKDKVTGKRNHHAYKDPSEFIIIEDAIPAIISKELFEKAQSFIRKNKGVNQNKVSFKAVTPYYLRGKAVCADCGRPLRGNRRKGGNNKESLYSSYDCAGRDNKICTAKGIKKELLEEAVMELIKQSLTGDNLLRVANRVNEKRDEAESPNANRKQRLKEQVISNQQKINNALDFIFGGSGTKAIKERIEELEKENENIEKQLQAMEQETSLLHFDMNSVKNAATKALSTLKNTQSSLLAEVFESFVEEVRVGGTDVEICLSLAPVFVVDKHYNVPPQPKNGHHRLYI